MSPLPVAFLTDYGPGSEHVGALHAVVAARCPGAERIDLAHDLEPGDVRWGALLLARLAALLPASAVCAVVDPGVGTERRGLAVALGGGRFVVGPDNGLLGPACAALGADDAVELTSADHRREPVAPTFHGRDVFAPAAAHLAGDGALADLGPAVEPTSVVAPQLTPARVEPGRLDALAVGRDRFGNLSLLAGPSDLEAAGMRPGDRIWVLVGERRQRAAVGRVFADVPRGGLLVYVDSHDLLAVAVNGGSAAERLRVAPGEAMALATIASPL
jgi:S-adenosyl-L-methionine hydrolase (adenosine-forming)